MFDDDVRVGGIKKNIDHVNDKLESISVSGNVCHSTFSLTSS